MDNSIADLMPGFDVKRFDGLTDSLTIRLKCSICLGIFREPVETTCEHTFCCNCIKRWFKTSKSCPECRQPLITKRTTRSSANNSEPKLKANRLVKQIVNDLKYKCYSDTNGCQKFVDFGTIEGHLEDCDQYLCEDLCGLKMGKSSEHNCQELIEKDMNDFKNIMIENKRKFDESDDKSKQLEEAMEQKRKQYGDRLKRWDAMLETRLEVECNKSLKMFENINRMIIERKRVIDDIKADPEFEHKHDSAYKKRLAEVETETEEIVKQLQTDREMFEDIYQPFKKMKKENRETKTIKKLLEENEIKFDASTTAQTTEMSDELGTISGQK